MKSIHQIHQIKSITDLDLVSKNWNFYKFCIFLSSTNAIDEEYIEDIVHCSQKEEITKTTSMKKVLRSHENSFVIIKSLVGHIKRMVDFSKQNDKSLLLDRECAVFGVLLFPSDFFHCDSGDSVNDYDGFDDNFAVLGFKSKFPSSYNFKQLSTLFSQSEIVRQLNDEMLKSFHSKKDICRQIFLDLGVVLGKEGDFLKYLVVEYDNLF